MSPQQPRRPVPVDVPPEQREALHLWVVLSRAYHALAARAAADVSRHELTIAEFGVLEALLHKGPMLLGEVQRSLLVSSGGVTYLVDRLTARGLVRREACASDRRARYAVLTPAGEALLREIFPAHAAAVTAACAGLEPAEQQAAAELLKRLGRAAAGPGEGAAGAGAAADAESAA